MGFEGTSLWAGVISGGMSQLEATKALNGGQLNKKQYAVHTTKNVTGAVGVMAGIEYGAVLGSALIPGVGTVVGSILGGIVGDRLGKYVGTQAGHLMFNQQLQINEQFSLTNLANNPDLQNQYGMTTAHHEETSSQLH